MAIYASATAIGGLWGENSTMEPPGRFDLLSVSDDQRHIVQSTLAAWATSTQLYSLFRRTPTLTNDSSFVGWRWRDEDAGSLAADWLEKSLTSTSRTQPLSPRASARCPQIYK
ncbi:hypothetical protein EYF80_044174 [Liparis tanakae]|uniref:Uncharacterized protein n=1 Tax=Liparis tanakae TaxID=230148 RepID=A0A4Z2FWI1_9TELE|nr:hypothetical protein EYF80_044174 [Liparis tanakae]